MERYKGVPSQRVRTRLPAWFQELYWWGDSSLLDLNIHGRVIIPQIINHGQWKHWQWLAEVYGKKRLKNAVQEIPASEFRQGALRLLALLLGIDKMNYASRSDYIKTKRGSQTT